MLDNIRNCVIFSLVGLLAIGSYVLVMKAFSDILMPWSNKNKSGLLLLALFVGLPFLLILILYLFDLIFIQLQKFSIKLTHDAAFNYWVIAIPAILSIGYLGYTYWMYPFYYGLNESYFAAIFTILSTVSLYEYQNKFRNRNDRDDRV